jgi:methyl-accepting chemotaxis protein
MVKSIDEIHTASHAGAKIMQAVDGIAFQTNILALNAAVEAARAGAAGAAAALVADVSHGSEEQANGTEQIARALAEMESLTERGAASAE